MAESKKSKAFYWLVTLISGVAMVALMIIKPEWFWLALPFFLTYLVLALDVI